MPTPEDSPGSHTYYIPNVTMRQGGAVLRFTSLTLEVDQLEMAQHPDDYAQLLARLGYVANADTVGSNPDPDPVEEKPDPRPPLGIINREGTRIEVVNSDSVCQFMGSLPHHSDSDFRVRRSQATKIWSIWSRTVQGNESRGENLEELLYHPGGNLAYIPLSRFNELASLILTTASLGRDGKYILTELQASLRNSQLIEYEDNPARASWYIKREHLGKTIPVITSQTFTVFIAAQPEYSGKDDLSIATIASRLWISACAMIGANMPDDDAIFKIRDTVCIPLTKLNLIVNHMERPEFKTKRRRLEIFRRLRNELRQCSTIE